MWESFEYTPEKNNESINTSNDWAPFFEVKDWQTDIISSLENMSNTKEVFDALINEVLQKYLDKLQQEEGINLSIENIYDDISNILLWLESKIGDNNIYNWKINIIRNNFLKPKEKCLKIIRPWP